MKINLDIDSKALILRLKNGERRLAYAAANAINATARRVQEAERAEVDKEFTLRKAEFVKRQAAIIKPFASVSQGRPFAEISVGKKDRLLLSVFERGGERKPFTPGAKSVAEPVIGGPARPSFQQPVTPELRVGRLKFTRTKTGRRRASVTSTKTYLVKNVGIFSRVSSEQTKAVYLFSKGKRVKPRLRFIETARQSAGKWFKEEMEREVVKAIVRVRGAGL